MDLVAEARAKKVITCNSSWDLPLTVIKSSVPAEVQAEWIAYSSNTLLAIASNYFWGKLNGWGKDNTILDIANNTHFCKSAEIYGYYDAGKHDEYSGVVYKFVVGSNHCEYEAVCSAVYNSCEGLQMKSVLVRKNKEYKKVA